uniref:SAC domain-containing protein n=1 Tax=Leersia perrieri TaxID=77586 RepID=A0A0D9XLD9_9ORYZ
MENTVESQYESAFVWNKFLVQGFQEQIKSPFWTVPLVHGYFRQVKMSVPKKDFWLTIIARRSHHFAGPRFLKRGVNELGQVANDVETEQIVFEDTDDKIPPQITSVVQRRGSVPLHWSQETPQFRIKTDILINRDEEYKATRLHFESLMARHGNPIIVLNLLKIFEKKPHESALQLEFARTIDDINENSPAENLILYACMDMKYYSQRKEEVVRAQLGVLRTNCLDCLDRTNSAQYAYAITAFGHQLEALGLIEELKISEDDPLFHNVMDLYEEMGDVLSMQYTGSAAQHKMFWDIKGQSCVISSFQEVIRSIQPYMHNTLWDRGKQDALNVLFGHCQPQQGKPLPPLLCGSEASCNDEEHGSGSNTMVQGRHLVLGTQNRTREPKYQKAFYSNFMEDLPPAEPFEKAFKGFSNETK